MSLFLIVLAAGDGKRLKSKTPKPFNKVNNKTLLEYSLDTFKNFPEIKNARHRFSVSMTGVFCRATGVN